MDLITVCIKSINVIYGDQYKFFILCTESVHYCCGNFFGTGSGGLIIDDLMCSGPETRLLDCAFTSVAQFHNAGCNHGDDVVIRCYSKFHIGMPRLQRYYDYYLSNGHHIAKFIHVYVPKAWKRKLTSIF